MSATTYMPHVAFDTLAYANKLKAVGLDPKIAEAHAELQATVLTDLTTNQLATKKDLQDLKFELKLEISDLRGEVRTEIAKLKNELLIKGSAMMGAYTIILGTLMTVLTRMH